MAISSPVSLMQTMAQAKRMIASHKTIPGNPQHVILVSHQLKEDLMYDETDKKALKGLIEADWFASVEAKVKAIQDLVNLDRVEDLINYIYDECIPAGNKEV